jgi:hypothetical protein
MARTKRQFQDDSARTKQPRDDVREGGDNEVEEDEYTAVNPKNSVFQPRRGKQQASMEERSTSSSSSSEEEFQDDSARTK